MLDLAWKNIKRQRTRTFLTTLGILIGIAAIVSLGSIAEGLDATIQNSLKLSAGKITVTEKDSGFFGFFGELNDDDLAAVESVPGVKDVVPIIIYAENIQALQGPSWVTVGIDPSKGDYFIGENADLEDGRQIDEGESGGAMAGSTFAAGQHLAVGDIWTIKDEDFEIVGILEETGVSDIDSSIIVPFADLQAALKTDTFQTIYVIPDDIRDTERLANEIKDASDRLDALTSQDLARQVGDLVNQIRVFTFGIGAIAAFVGGLGVMNTMIMAVMERRREIGVMKAIGATNRKVLMQILTESAMISFIGGAGGILLGMLGALVLSSVIGGGQISATVTPGLALTGLSFALFLGVIGGLYPARKASRLDPVEALRYE
jgi:putative ABC transport system permease protein